MRRLRRASLFLSASLFERFGFRGGDAYGGWEGVFGSSSLNGSDSAFHLTVEGPPQTFSPVLQDEISRMGREMLRNAFHYARAKRIEVEIRYDDRMLRLRIRDDGIGIDPKVLAEGARAGHWGLPGIRKRAKLIGAQLDFWSEAGAGTEVQVTVPTSVAYPRSRNGRIFGSDAS